MKYILAFIILVHGLIHFLGFAKAFNYGNISQLTKEITKTNGIVWSIAALLLIATASFFMLKMNSWMLIGLVAILVSQVLIFYNWGDAKYGTIANILILLAIILSWGSWRFENEFQKDVKTNLESVTQIESDVVTLSDLKNLPDPVQKYLKYANVVGKPKVKNFKAVLEGEMRSKKQDWFPFTVVQYDFFDSPTRLFFMKGKMFGITVPGYHRYTPNNAKMDIRLFGLFKVVFHEGGILNQTETVTLFNDMCLMAPASLISENIKWTSIDSLSAKATYTVADNSIEATLYFNSEGQLINFISNDRTSIDDMMDYPFSTPVHHYIKLNNVPIVGEADAVWHYPEGEFVYGRFFVKEIEYNAME